MLKCSSCGCGLIGEDNSNQENYCEDCYDAINEGAENTYIEKGSEDCYTFYLNSIESPLNDW